MDRPELIGGWPPYMRPLEGISPCLRFTPSEMIWMRRARQGQQVEKLRLEDVTAGVIRSMTPEEQWGYNAGLSTRPPKIQLKQGRRRKSQIVQSDTLF